MSNAAKRERMAKKEVAKGVFIGGVWLCPPQISTYSKCSTFTASAFYNPWNTARQIESGELEPMEPLPVPESMPFRNWVRSAQSLQHPSEAASVKELLGFVPSISFLADLLCQIIAQMKKCGVEPSENDIIEMQFERVNLCGGFVPAIHIYVSAAAAQMYQLSKFRLSAIRNTKKQQAETGQRWRIEVL